MNRIIGFPMRLLVFMIMILLVPSIQAQSLQFETGVAIGNVTTKHSLGKAELHFNLLKCYNFGQLGLDFATGGNFIPGERSTLEGNTETLSPNDSKFSSINVLYRRPIKKAFFVEPRMGYASLFSFVHTDDSRKITQPNFTMGLGVGGYIGRFTFSLRYQYYGKTASYQGARDNTVVISNPESFDLVLLRMSYRFGLDRLFKLEPTSNNCYFR